MAQLRQTPAPPLPATRVAELEVELRFEPTYEFEMYVTDFKAGVTDDPGWRLAIEEYLTLTCQHGESCWRCGNAARGGFPDEWPTSQDADAARARRDAVLEAGGSRADAVNAMHPVNCTCRRHKRTTR